VRPFGSIDEWVARRPWEALRIAMRDELSDFSWTEMCFGTAFLAVGCANPAEEVLRTSTRPQ
jgi:demethylmenaquinone methyltransferase/2-methoxy-6-polyprenyl-1,4-benzoquinol methylase